MKTKIMIIVAALAATIFTTACGSNQSGGSPTPDPGVKAQFAYVLSQADEKVYQYESGTDGSLAALSVSTVNVGAYATSMIMDSTKSYVYVANAGDDTISQFTIGSDGALTLLSALHTPAQPWTLVLSPDQSSVYSVNMSADNITRYTIGPNGELSVASTIAAGDGPVSMAFSPSGEYAYVVNLLNNTISQYSVAVDGSLTALTPASIATTTCPTGPVATTKTSAGNSFLYTLSCSTNQLEVFAIGSDGALSAVEAVATGDSPQGMAISGSYLYTANAFSSTVSMFSIGATDGRLTPLAQPTISAGSSPETLAVDPVLKAAYVLDYLTNEIIQYQLNSSGELSATGKSPVSTGTAAIQILLK